MSLPFQFNAEEIISRGRTTKTHVETIRTWLRDHEETFIPKVLPDELIVEFLLSCENDIAFTQATILAHYKLKKDAPELYDNRDAEGEDIKRLFDMWTIAAFPKRTKENYAIHYFRLDDGDYKKFDIPSVLKSTIMLVDVTLDKDPPDGFITINDMRLVGIMHLSKVTFEIIRKYFSFIQEGMPMKIKAIHIMNSNFVVDKLFSLIKKCIKNDVFDKIHFHSSNEKWEKFHEHIPPECLPKEYGGDLPSVKELSEITQQQFKNRQDFWNKEETLRKQYQ